MQTRGQPWARWMRAVETTLSPDILMSPPPPLVQAMSRPGVSSSAAALCKAFLLQPRWASSGQLTMIPS